MALIISFLQKDAYLFIIKKSMRIFIPYKHTSDDGLEMKYTIRSMVKHFKDMTGCIVIGDIPTWYSGDYIQASDFAGRKEFSIYCKLKLLKETILHLNDDFFALKDFNSKIPNYYSGTCGEKANLAIDKTYKDLYLNCPPDWLNFDIHCPIVLDTEKFEWYIDRPLKTYYANQNNLKGEYLSDCKIRGHNLHYGEIKQRIIARPFFSTADNVDSPGMRRIMHNLYPKKSIYEK